jgi:hypothetical protein
LEWLRFAFNLECRSWAVEPLDKPQSLPQLAGKHRCLGGERLLLREKKVGILENHPVLNAQQTKMEGCAPHSTLPLRFPRQTAA